MNSLGQSRVFFSQNWTFIHRRASATLYIIPGRVCGWAGVQEIIIYLCRFLRDHFECSRIILWIHEVEQINNNGSTLLFLMNRTKSMKINFKCKLFFVVIHSRNANWCKPIQPPKSAEVQAEGSNNKYNRQQ